MFRKHRIFTAYILILLMFTTYVMLDTFVITRVYGDAASAASGSESTQDSAQDQSGSDNGSQSGSSTDQNAAQGSDSSGDQGSMADQFSSDEEDSDAGNMHSGSGQGSSGGHGGPGSGSGHGPGSGKGPGRHSKSSGSSSGSSGNSGSSGSSDSGSSGNSGSSGSSDSGSSGNSGSSGSSGSGSSGGSGTLASSDQASGSQSSGSTDSSSGSGLQKSGSSSALASNGAAVSADTYSDGDINITLKEYRENDSTIYVADVQLSSASYLKTALAQNAYGRNVTQKTSEIAESVNAILAINGDFYGAQEKGYVIKNGVLYRDTALANQEDLVIYKDGSFGIVNESKVTAQQLIDSGAVQTLSFGPALVQNGQISVTEDEEVGKAMASNPRTAIGIIDENHYVLVVSDGRTSESEGLSLSELAEFMQSLGVSTAYNLDGGGSSTMYFNGSVVNNPTTGGSNSRERSVSDIVYIGK